ncbi:alpha/beta fold hydrolase [Curtobacterium sp. MCBD17_040]|uniref:alpha/beta fold hydrolase n=1 Tax=Curtobacterium sp. MCBD17_040 TaxID=2175674 RepID=UPI000DAA607A|nr:alpha/beta fold hydrolase [Curtobacterium sp. MCBD17_040]WIB62374.1 alpha/beta fold hydrolase [Curtobacterium sp. MCBD17_040]
MTEPDPDEFSDLPALAAHLGVTEPLRASRLTATVGDGATVSAVRWRATAAATRDAHDVRVVFLHGVGLEAHTFDATALLLGVPALAVDLPGHGRSSWRADAVYSADTVAPAVVDALDALGTPPVVLVGHSLGAIVAARVAAIAPGRVTGLVLLDMSPDFTQRAVDRIVRALEEEPDFADLDEVVVRALALRLGDDPVALAREARHATRRAPDGRWVRRHHFPHLEPGAAHIGRFADAWDDLESLPVPVLLVRGDRGYVSQALARRFAERLPSARIVTVPARHTVQTQAPRELADVLRRWEPTNPR